MSLVNLMKDKELVGGSDMDKADLVANGLKILKVLTTENNYVIQIVEDYEMCARHVLSLLESYLDRVHIFDLAIQDSHHSRQR